jgi:hypothetical protein
MFIEAEIKKWARPTEFAEGKRIKFLNLEALTTAEATERDGRPPLYPPASGTLYRITFLQNDFKGERTMDLNSPGIKNDLAGKIDGPGEVGILTRVNKGTTNKYGKPDYRWTWQKDGQRPNQGENVGLDDVSGLGNKSNEHGTPATSAEVDGDTGDGEEWFK